MTKLIRCDTCGHEESEESTYRPKRKFRIEIPNNNFLGRTEHICEVCDKKQHSKMDLHLNGDKRKY